MILGLFPGLESVGGIQTAGKETIAALARIAARRRWGYIFFSLNDSSGEHQLRIGDDVVRFSGFDRKKMTFVHAATRAAFRLQPRIIFGAHPHLSPVSALARIAARGSRTIIGTHGVEVWTKLSAFRRKTLRAGDMVLAPSFFTAKKLADEQGVAKRQIRVLPWSIAPDFLRLASNTNGSTAPIAGQKHTILSVGRWEEETRYKGADLLIEALAQLKKNCSEAHLVLAGPGNDIPRLETLAEKCGVGSAVQFLQNLSREELAALYARADIFALPSTGEGFGLVFLEAMAFGKPVIGAAAGGIPDIVENGQTGFLITPGDRNELASTIQKLLRDDPLRLQMGEQAKRRVKEKFSFEVFEQRLEQLVEECLAG